MLINYLLSEFLLINAYVGSPMFMDWRPLYWSLGSSLCIR